MIKGLKIVFIALLLLAGNSGWAQKTVQYKIVGENIFATIPLNEKSLDVDSVLASFGFKGIDGIQSQKSEKGWQFYSKTQANLILVLNKNKNTKELPNAYVITDAEVAKVIPRPFAWYGVNKLKSESVRPSSQGTQFFLKGYLDADQVYLSGTFNEWSTMKTPMQKTRYGWVVTLNLPPGKHLYKFIVDGHWMRDKENSLREDDGNNGYNSVYFVYNHTFRLKGFSDARKVALAGSFCNWQPIAMTYNKSKGEWQLPMYLREGTHAYKFVVEDKWITDPYNAVTRGDGMGNVNSFMSVGDTFFFELPGQFLAERVTVAGNFNNWNFEELEMKKTNRGWVLPYVLAPGNYEYKFKVDDHYMTDPDNKISNGAEQYRNSVLVIQPNMSFTLPGYADAETVLLSGSFNDWSTTGYTMKRESGQWVLRIHLDPGKHTYKFLVDGNWVIDPENPLWERNEYNTRNSVIWVDEFAPQP